MKNTPGFKLLSSDAREGWVVFDGAHMRYQHAGHGYPLVLLHGLLGYSFSWRFVLPEISRQATVYAPDMLGTGFSDRVPGMDVSLRGSAERLLRFLDGIDVRTIDLLGTSHGGGVAMMAAALAPQRIRSLILVAPVNPWSARGTWLAPILSGRMVSAMFLAAAPFLKIAHSVLLRRLYGDTRRIPPGTVEGYSAPLAIPGSFQYALSVLRTWKADLLELEGMLPRIAEIPTLLLWGSEDRAVAPASARILGQHLRHSRLLAFDGVGHLPYEEVPAQFNLSVSQFLSQLPTGVRA